MLNHPLHYIAYYQRHYNAQQVQAHHHQTLLAQNPKIIMVGHYQRNEDGINRQPCAAAHQRRNHDGEQPFFAVFNIARAHNGGHGTGKATNHGHYTFAVQSYFAHNSIAEKRDARHIAGVFQYGYQPKQNHDLRNEHQDAA